MEPAIAAWMSRRRPSRIANSFPATLAAVPSSAKPVATSVGARGVPVMPVLAAT
jgi:hypothetical protein